MLTKAELIKEFKNRCMLACNRQGGRGGSSAHIVICELTKNCERAACFCETVINHVVGTQLIWFKGIKEEHLESDVKKFRNHIETAYQRNPTGYGDSFGEILCYEIHETGLTFKDLARVWNVDLEFLGEVIKDHCVKLKPIEGAL